MIRYDDLTLSYLESIPSARGADAMPLVVLLHGRGADAEDLAGLAPEIDGPGGYRFIFAEAPNRFEIAPGAHFGYTWFDGWPPSQPSLRDSRERLMRFLDEIHRRYGAADDTTAICGFSQGGLMALDVGFRRPQPPAAIVCLSGGIHEPDLPQLSGQPMPPVLIVHGSRDELLPVDLGRHVRDVLHQHGLDAEYHELEIGHEISGEEIEIVRRFLEQHL